MQLINRQTHTITVPANIDDDVFFNLPIEVELEYTPFNPGNQFEPPTYDAIEIIECRISDTNYVVAANEYVTKFYTDKLLTAARKQHQVREF